MAHDDDDDDEALTGLRRKTLRTMLKVMRLDMQAMIEGLSEQDIHLKRNANGTFCALIKLEIAKGGEKRLVGAHLHKLPLATAISQAIEIKTRAAAGDIDPRFTDVPIWTMWRPWPVRSSAVFFEKARRMRARAKRKTPTTAIIRSTHLDQQGRRKPPMTTAPTTTTMNDRRAAWARIALKTFADLTGLDEADGPDTQLADLLADLRHMAHIDHLDYQEADERAAIRAYNEILAPDPDLDEPMPTLAAGDDQLHLIVVEINSAGRVADVFSSFDAAVAIIFTEGEDHEHRTYPATLLDESGIQALEAIAEWPIIHAKLPEGVRDQYPLANEDEA